MNTDCVQNMTNIAPGDYSCHHYVPNLYIGESIGICVGLLA